MAKKNQPNKIDNETIVNDTLELLWENRGNCGVNLCWVC